MKLSNIYLRVVSCLMLAACIPASAAKPRKANYLAEADQDQVISVLIEFVFPPSSREITQLVGSRGVILGRRGGTPFIHVWLPSAALAGLAGDSNVKSVSLNTTPPLPE